MVAAFQRLRRFGRVRWYKPVEAFVCQVLKQEWGVLRQEGIEQEPLRFQSRLFDRCVSQRVCPHHFSKNKKLTC
jgi:hypothetical protein